MKYSWVAFMSGGYAQAYIILLPSGRRIMFARHVGGDAGLIVTILYCFIL